MKKQTQRILKYLEARAGEKVKLKAILGHLEEEKKHRKVYRPRKGRTRPEPDVSQDPLVIIAELELLGLVIRDGSRLLVRNPFSIEGKVSMNSRGLGFVTATGADPAARDIFLSPTNAGGALGQDVVELRLLDRKRERFEGEVIRVVRRSREIYRCRLLSEPRRDGILGILLDTPGNITAHLASELIPSDTLQNLKQDSMIIVRLTGDKIYKRGSFFHEAEFLRIEGGDEAERDFNRILIKYNLNPGYPADVDLPDADVEPGPNTVRDWSVRRDLRDLETITIDGATSKDFDDAISLTRRRNTYKLFVHIADVGYYVARGSRLDEEARERATSVYLVDRVVPMLPPSLSENLCSLVAGKNRLAFTAELDISVRSGKVKKAEFYRSVIKVDRRLTYEQAEEQLDLFEKKAKADPLLSSMWELAELQKRLRLGEGRIDLAIPEPKLKYGKDNTITGFEYRPRLKSSMLIEEFMLSANVAVAEFLRRKSAPVLYRIHETMDEAKLENLNSFFEIYNIDFVLKDTSQKSITKALKHVSKHPRADVVERIFNMLLLRSFMQAKYAGEPLGHWGLGFSDYCHFTSPIRRYPDLVVHRALNRVLHRKKAAYSPSEIDELGLHTSDQERRAMDAERDMMRLKLIRFVESSGRRNFHGVVTGIRSDRVFLELEEAPAEGVVSAVHLTNDPELIIPNNFSVYIKKLSRPAFLGERWALELDRVDPEEMRLYFRPDFKQMESPFV